MENLSSDTIISEVIKNFKMQHGLDEGGTTMEMVQHDEVDANPDPELKSLVEELKVLDSEVDVLNESIKKRKERIDTIEYMVKSFLEKNGLDATKVSGMKFSIKQKMGFKVEDWQKVWDWVSGSGNTQVIRKQLNSTSLQELLDHGDLPEFIVPNPFTEIARSK